MIGHQRDVLTALGIDIWIPKGEVCQARPRTTLWRDQASEPETQIILPVAVPVARSESQIQHIPDVIVQPQASVQALEPERVTDSVIREHFEISGFSLQALSLPHCVIVIDATTLTESEQILWANIQRAGNASFAELNWPFAWQAMQNGRGASSYVRGFLDAMSVEKNLLLLGQVPHLEHDRAIQLASLQEMLDQPILKKRLWQFMRAS